PQPVQYDPGGRGGVRVHKQPGLPRVQPAGRRCPALRGAGDPAVPVRAAQVCRRLRHEGAKVSYRDPVFAGATDPVVVRDVGSGEWWMFYTQRRASVPGPGVAWV